MRGCDVYVIGAGNSAGQAAVHLAKYGAQVTMVVRGESLSASMSTYLIREIANTPAIDVRVRCEVVDGAGDDRLESVTVRDTRTGACEARRASAVFVMIGGEPLTGWLDRLVQRDRSGYILTGRDLLHDNQAPVGWPLTRLPLMLETSTPGIFAAGDVCYRSVKRVASAVGEGAMAVQLVHEHLGELDS
jgi:thioredoxin reductase (NADPH)